MSAREALMVALLGWQLAAGATMPAHAATIEQASFELDAPGISEQPIRARVYLPPDYATTQARYDVLYVNDGQDMDAVRMRETLQRLYETHAITRMIVVAIDMPPDRMAGYGLFDRGSGGPIVAPTKYGGVGANAGKYASWLTQVLVPAVDARYRTLPHADDRAILGWSLGAISAFGIGWQYPETFGRVGAFSPSFWLAADNKDAGSVQASRIAHRLVDGSPAGARPRLFFGVGTQEETDDRDGDGVIDVLDDTRDLADGWKGVDGASHRGVRQAGAESAVLFVLDGGRHDQRSWARMLPVFLRWAYGRDSAGRAAR